MLNLPITTTRKFTFSDKKKKKNVLLKVKKKMPLKVLAIYKGASL